MPRGVGRGNIAVFIDELFESENILLIKYAKGT